MKSIIIVLSFIVIALGCKKDAKKDTKVLFYTNAQYVLNCGSFDVDIYIDSVKVGVLKEPYILNNVPNSNDEGTILVGVTKGIHSYYAVSKCDQCGEIYWKGTFNTSMDSCSKIYLDIESVKQLKRKL